MYNIKINVRIISYGCSFFQIIYYHYQYSIEHNLPLVIVIIYNFI
jgi:hypothetical protein